MADFRSFTYAGRIPAKPLPPVVAPARWTPAAPTRVDDFAYRITDRDADELIAGIAAFRRRDVPIESVSRDNFPLDRFAGVLADVRRELVDGRGLVMLRGFP